MNPTIPWWLWYPFAAALPAAIVGGAIMLIWRATIWARRWLLVGATSPAAVMEVGGTDSVVVALYLKKRWSLPDLAPLTDAVPVTFAFRVKSGKNLFLLVSPATATSADGKATVVLRGIAVGHGVLEVSGTDANGERYEPLDLHVHVVVPDASAIHLYEVAALIGRDYWFNTLLGNAAINERKLPPKGLCDQWADWGAGFLARNEKGQICNIYRMGTEGHALLRVRLCDGRVYYLDPWHKFAGSQVVYTQAQWEADNGGPPSQELFASMFHSRTCECENP